MTSVSVSRAIPKPLALPAGPIRLAAICAALTKNYADRSNPTSPESVASNKCLGPHSFVGVLRLGGFGVMLRASQRWPRYAGDHAGTQHRARTDTSAFRTAARFPTTPLGPWIGSRRGARASRVSPYSYNTVYAIPMRSAVET